MTDSRSNGWALSAVTDEPWTAASTSAPELGINAFRILEREEGAYRIRVTRADSRDLRDTHATLVIIEGLGTPAERTTTQEVTLTRDTREREIPLGG